LGKTPGKATGNEVARWLGTYRREGAVAALIVLLSIGLGIVEPAFLTPGNWRDILTNAAAPAIAAVGMTGLIVAGAIDISVGSIFAVCAVAAGLSARSGWPLPLVALTTLGAGSLLGAVNGMLVAYAGIPAIIVTLGTMGILRGLMTWITEGVWIRNLPPSFTALGEGSWIGIPYGVWIAAACAAGGGLLLARTRFGRYAYAIGSNSRGARLVGIRVPRILVGLFLLSGALVGLAALVQASRFTVIQSNAGKGFELQVITAVVIGGTDIFGGRGTVLGSALGALLLAVVSTALTFLRIPAEWEPAVQGALILLAVVGQGTRWRKAATTDE
jgi:ribose/xylose/arabinose/galactoside ABC-type transport system permease subunit